MLEPEAVATKSISILHKNLAANLYARVIKVKHAQGFQRG